MKHPVGIVLLTASLSFAAAAQAATCQVGLKAGVAIQKLGGDDVESNQVENRTGFAGGAYFQADLSRNFGVRVEALYFMKGASADSADASLTIKLDYIEFPVLAVAHVPISDAAHLDIFGGPTFAFKTKAEVEASLGPFSGTADIGDAVKGFDFGLTFGAGLSFDVGSSVIGIDGRYGFGLNTIADPDFSYDSGFGTISSDADVKNQGFAIMGSVGFPIGEK